MRVRDWMTADPVCVSPDASVAEARQLLERGGFRHLPVVDGGRLIGVVSDRDIVISDAALRAAVGRNDVVGLLDDGRPVEAVMSEGPHVIEPDASMSDAARLLVSRRISALPVVTEDGALVGILTSVDCLLAMLQQTADV